MISELTLILLFILYYLMFFWATIQFWECFVIQDGILCAHLNKLSTKTKKMLAILSLPSAVFTNQLWQDVQRRTSALIKNNFQGLLKAWRYSFQEEIQCSRVYHNSGIFTEVTSEKFTQNYLISFYYWTMCNYWKVFRGSIENSCAITLQGM